jgi:hypothetical protein
VLAQHMQDSESSTAKKQKEKQRTNFHKSIAKKKILPADYYKMNPSELSS